MPQDCSHTTTDLKLTREGVNQAQRMLAALAPTYAPVDARELEHYVVLAKKYAKYLKFFETADTASGTWEFFFDNDPLVAIANSLVALLDKTQLKEAAEVQNTIKTLQNQLNLSLLQNSHQPHYALFLAFVKLLALLQEKTNTLTERHLDFYYRDVLQLREKPAEPSQVHLLVELAKNINDYSIAKDTVFKAGKDSKNNDAFFANDRELIANQAKVAALKTAFLSSDGKLCALPITNSDNGLQPELTSPDGSWQPFFNANGYKPNAEVGFAVASHYLYLMGGTRTVTLNISSNNKPILTKSNESCFLAFLTTEKGWLGKSVTVSTSNQLQIALSGDDPAIVPYNVKTHGGSFQTQLPMLRIMLRQDSSAGFYTHFKSLPVDAITLSVKVQNLKDLAVSNDFGPVDISKPFQPFGALPQAGSALVVGSKELFQKNYSSATVNVNWQLTAKPYNTTPTIQISLLEEGQWAPPKSNDNFLTVSSFEITPTIFENNTIDFSENEIFTATSKNGFAKFHLRAGFGFAEYQMAVIDAIINKKTPPPAPIAPTIDAISLSYNAADEAPAFFHVMPFGHQQVASPSSLLPQFQASSSLESLAEFYIGISDLKPPQNLSLLFQVADGTANPLADKPEPHLYWSYLSQNEWIPFQKDQVNDITNELLNSGIITLSFPNENKATADNTLMPQGLYWVKVVVKEKADAVCKLVMVAAQALQATFTDLQNDPAFTSTTLPAGTISKMEEPQAAVKKIEQLFGSFGGRGKETSEAFYTRVSERLRHRDRAVALWDYEHLILEAFPQIHQVKCLNHTRYEPTENSGGVYHELSPGHVTVVALPNQQFQKAIDPLRPYTSLGVLAEMETFLKKRVSCFVKLHVKNPDFEAIKADFKVKFYAGIDETFHVNLLKGRITRYLSPWAYGGPSPTFGGKIYQSALINFIEEQPYVDYVTDFKLLDKDNLPQNEISPSKAVSILVSVPKEQHVVEVIRENNLISASENCHCHA
jgi:hypothetical protein